MKKFLAILLCVLTVVSLSACTMGTDLSKANQTSSEATEAQKVDINKYDKDFQGMQDYLVELKLINDKKDNKTETQADIIGAKQGVRYKLDATNIVEFYEFDITATPDEAENVLSAFAKGESYNVLGIEDVKGVVSNSGKYVMLYPATSSYDYSKIEEEFVKF